MLNGNFRKGILNFISNENLDFMILLFTFIGEKQTDFVGNKTVKRSVLVCPKCGHKPTSKTANRHFRLHGMTPLEISELKAAHYGRKDGPRSLRKCEICCAYVCCLNSFFSLKPKAFKGLQLAKPSQTPSKRFNKTDDR